MNHLDALLILNAVDGLGSVGLRKLQSKVGHLSDVFKLKDADWQILIQEKIISPRVVQNIKKFPKDSFLKKEYNLLLKNSVSLLSFFDKGYPCFLKEIIDPPMLLYTKGSLDVLTMPMVAMVGSRKASIYGLSVAHRLSGQLAERGLVVVSGLALGIDAVSHQGALQSGGMTVGVLGCGLNEIYPPQNRTLADQIAQQGLILSEFTMDAPPRATHFPRRNRIVSGLSLGVVVVEAALKSGALITAHFALEQGREVFAVPGKIDQLQSSGTNALIKDGAKMVLSVDDICEELSLSVVHVSTQQVSIKEEPSRQRTHLTKEELDVYRLISQIPIHIDDLAMRCQLSIQDVLSTILKLEIKNAIKQLPGRMIVRMK